MTVGVECRGFRVSWGLSSPAVTEGGQLVLERPWERKLTVGRSSGRRATVELPWSFQGAWLGGNHPVFLSEIEYRVGSMK